MDKLAPALIKAKKAFGPVLKSKTNPAFKSKYANLEACLDAVDEACLNAGIALYQETSEDSTGITVETVFLHESGQVLRCGKLHVPAAKQDPQGYGSALTYARRYSLLAACGIAAEDDDGNAAVQAQQNQPKAADRTLVMKVRSAIQEHIANGRDLGALQEWQALRDLTNGEEIAKGVWSGLTTPERSKITELQDAARTKEAA